MRTQEPFESEIMVLWYLYLLSTYFGLPQRSQIFDFQDKKNNGLVENYFQEAAKKCI